MQDILKQPTPSFKLNCGKIDYQWNSGKYLQIKDILKQLTPSLKQNCGKIDY